MAEPPLRLHITTRSGSVRVTAAPGEQLSAQGATVEEQDDGTIRIRRESASSEIVVRCAPGTDATIGTVSGSVECHGDLGAVRIATVSGAIRLESATQADLRSTSGVVDVGSCTNECRVMTKSSKVHVGHAGRAIVAAVSGIVYLAEVGGAEVKSVSAKVLLSLAPGAGRISVRSVSGKVEVRVPATMRPATRLRSISGTVRCDVASGDGAEVAVASVSGAIRVSAA